VTSVVSRHDFAFPERLTTSDQSDRHLLRRCLAHRILFALAVITLLSSEIVRSVGRRSDLLGARSVANATMPSSRLGAIRITAGPFGRRPTATC
jgi:hypothetical protein